MMIIIIIIIITWSRFSGFSRVPLGSYQGAGSRFFQDPTRVSAFRFFQGSGLPVFLASRWGPGFSRVPLGSHYGPTMVPLQSQFSGFSRVPLGSHQGFVFPVFLGSRQGSPRVLVFRFFQGPARVPLESRVPVFQYTQKTYFKLKVQLTLKLGGNARSQSQSKHLLNTK